MDITLINEPKGLNLNVKPNTLDLFIGRPGKDGIGALRWIDATGNLTMIPGKGYHANSIVQILFALPIAPPFGTIISIRGFGLGGWKITQRAGEQINVMGSPNATTAGVTGFIQSVNQYDGIDLYYFGEWQAFPYGCALDW